MCRIFKIIFRLLFRLYFLKDGNIEGSWAGFRLPAQRYRIRRSVDVWRFKCIVSLYISWRSDQMTWILRNLRLRLVFRLRDAPKVRKSRSSVEFAYATSRGLQEKKIDESARSRASTHARHIHARACFLVHRFLVSSRANARPQSLSIINLKTLLHSKRSLRI